MLTYGDGVSNIDINRLLEFHISHGKIGTISAINVAQRFGVLDVKPDGSIADFKEKSENDKSIVNGGFMVMNPEIFDLLDGDECIFEKKPLETLAATGQLMAYKHEGFWQCMDTQRDKQLLEKLWESGNAPWKLWED